MKNSKQLNRREFLTAAGAAAVSLPYLIPSGVLASRGRVGANERITTAHIGVGGRGGGLLREDVRMALERIPIKRAVQALKAGFEVAPEDFKGNLAQSLRKRGVKVEGYPCVKLVPAK